ncbi:MAG TPA: tetratricopeptide repeat protein [Planctomycetota bacterium]
MLDLRPPSPRTAVLLLLGLAVVAYWPVVSCGFVWDDDDYVTQNPVLLSWAGLWQLWTEPLSLPQYYPLVHTTFWLEYRLWGLHPLGYHADNVLLHTLAACLAWRLARRLALPGAWFAAAWFLVHPVHVESVAWITERKNVLSLACALLASERWFAWHDGGARRDQVIASCAFLGALLSKSVTATLPGALLVLLWWRDGRLSRRGVLALVPWFAAGIIFALVTAYLEVAHVGAADPRWRLSGADRWLLAGRVPWFYLGCLLWPFGLCFNYERWQLDAASLAQWLWPAATLAALAAAFVWRARFGRGPPAVLLLFGGTLLPVLGFFDVFPFRYAFVADHFQYHASLAALFGLVAWLGPRAAALLPKPLLGTAALLLLGGNVVLTWHTLGAYRDLDTLWQRTLLVNPRSTLALTNLGGHANLRGDGPTAKVLFERALAIDPTLHEAWGNLGVIAHNTGDRATARAHYERALALKPGDAATNNNFAVLYLEQGQPREALAHAERAVAALPDYFEGRVTLGWALHDCGEWERALVELDWVLQRTPQNVLALQRAVRCLMRLGRHRFAASNAMVWLRTQPASAAAKAELVAAMAQVLRTLPPASVRATAENALRKSGLDPAPILPPVAAALRQLGATAQADAVAPK